MLTGHDGEYGSLKPGSYPHSTECLVSKTGNTKYSLIMLFLKTQIFFLPNLLLTYPQLKYHFFRDAFSGQIPIIQTLMKAKSESRSVVSNSLRPHVLYSPWNSPGQNTGVGSLSLLQGIFPTQGSNPGLPHCRWILYQLSHKRSPLTLRVGYKSPLSHQLHLHFTIT